MAEAGTGTLVQYELTIPMISDAELVAARATEEIARLVAFSERAVEQVRLAVIEACLNAIEHSHSADRRIYLTFVCDDEKLLIIVRDFGKGFDPLEVRQPDIREKLGAMNKGGWGLYLIRRLMDEVDFQQVSTGTCLRMTKRRVPCCPVTASSLP